MERGKVLSTRLLSQGYQKTKLVATVKNSIGDTMILSIPTTWPSSQPFLVSLPMIGHRILSEIPDIRVPDTTLSSVQGWWVKHAYQVMLINSGCLIKTFLLGTMPVGFKHSDLSFGNGLMSSRLLIQYVDHQPIYLYCVL